MRLTPSAFAAKWSGAQGRFKTNDNFLIGEVDLRDFAQDALDSFGLVANSRRGGPFYVKYLNHDEIGASAVGYGYAANTPGFGSALFDILGTDVCVGTQAFVEENHDNGVVTAHAAYVAYFDNRPEGSLGQFRGYLDGTFRPLPLSPDGLVPLRWYVQGSPELAAAVTANVPLLDPAKTDYPADYLVRYPFAGLDYLFRTQAAGGPFPAPPDYNGSAAWKAVAVPTPPTILCVSRPLDYVQHVVLPGNSVVAGLLYQLPGTWNGSATTQTVEVAGGQGGFAGLGTLVVGSTRTGVRVDVAAGTYQALSADAYTKAQADALFVTQQRLADLIGAAPAALDTLAEIAAQLQQDEQGAAALLATQQQHTQQLTQLAARTTDQVPEGSTNYYFTFARSLATKLTGYAKATAARAIAATDTALVALGILEFRVGDIATSLASLMAQLFGRNRGEWAANTAYLKYDFVSYQGTQYYANQAFTSGSSFNAANWTASAFATVSNLPFASTTQAGIVRIGAGLRAQASNGILRNEGVFYTRDQLSTYDGQTEASLLFGASYGLTNYPNATISVGTNTIAGDICAVRNLSASLALTLTSSDSQLIEGQSSYVLEAQGWAYFKYEAAGIRVVERGSLGAPGTGGGGPTYTAGTGIAISAQNVISATATAGGAVIDYANPVPHTAAATLDATGANKLHVLSGSDFTLTLPAGPATGYHLRIKAEYNAAGLYTIAGNGATIGGSNSLTLWAGESLDLIYTGVYWLLLTYDRKLASAVLQTNVSQYVPTSSYILIPYTQTLQQDAPMSPQLNADYSPGGTGSGIKTRRVGKVRVDAAFVVAETSTSGFYQMDIHIVRAANGSSETISIALAPSEFASGSGNFAMGAVTGSITVNPGDYIRAGFYATGGGKLRQDAATQACRLTVTEI